MEAKWWKIRNSTHPSPKSSNSWKNLLFLGFPSYPSLNLFFISHSKTCSFLASQTKQTPQNSTWFPLSSKMVQRKAPNKLGSQIDMRKGHAKPKRHAASDHQQENTRGNNMGGGDLKKMKSYMKPTSSSDARREHPLVSVLHPTSPKKISLGGNSNNLNCSRPSASSPSGCGTKPAKILTRKSSFKLARTSMRRSSGVALHPKKLVNSPTCSSTQKDSEFPKALDLNPGGTEAEGTSVMRVCPYNHCSLNGHSHPLMPPLKPFLKARRSSLITQKSMKLEGLSPFRKKGQEKDGVEADTGQVEENNDFFVEIYVKPQTLIIDSESCKGESGRGEEENPEVIEELSLIKDDHECGGAEFVEDGNVALSWIDEPRSNHSTEDDFDQVSDLSIEELDVMTSLLDYVDCDLEVEKDEEEQQSGQVCEEYAGWIFECCHLVDVSSKGGKGLADEEENLSICEANDIGWDEVGRYPESRTDCSEILDDNFGPTDDPWQGDELSFEPEKTLISCQIAGGDSGVAQEVCEEVAERNVTSFDGTSFENNDAEIDNARDVTVQEQLTDGLNLNSTPAETELSSEDHFHEDGYEEQESNGVDLETIQQDDTEQEEGEDEEITDNNSLYKIEQADSPQGFSLKEIFMYDVATEEPDVPSEIKCSYSPDQSDECNKRGNGTNYEKHQPEEKSSSLAQDFIQEDHIMPIKNDVKSNAEKNCIADIEENQERNEARQAVAENSDQPVPELDDKSRLKLNIARRRRTEDIEENREFNPRPPNFLPLEPDPEAEKVDLRHQLMDERKNAEEWMIDHALQQTVTRLAPARKKKVALLVEAFETVVPLPLCERPLQHSTRSFPHARPIQACS